MSDDVYGDLGNPGNPAVSNNTCGVLLGAVLAPGDGISCTFDVVFTGADGDSQTNVVTVTASNAAGQLVAASDDATARIAAHGPPADPPPPGSDPPPPVGGTPPEPPAFTTCPAAVAVPVNMIGPVEVRDPAQAAVAAAGVPTPNLQSTGPGVLTDHGDGTGTIAFGATLLDRLLSAVVDTQQVTTASSTAGSAACVTTVDVVIMG